MTPKEKNLEIAKICGWKIENYGPKGHETLYWRLREPNGTINLGGCAGKEWSHAIFGSRVPSYFYDLNAIRDAEKTLTWDWIDHEPTGEIFDNILKDICGSFRNAIHATAEQRAEAFGKTLGLW